MKYTLSLSNAGIGTAWETTFEMANETMAIDYCKRLLTRDAWRWQNSEWQLWTAAGDRLVSSFMVTSAITVVE